MPAGCIEAGAAELREWQALAEADAAPLYRLRAAPSRRGGGAWRRHGSDLRRGFKLPS